MRLAFAIAGMLAAVAQAHAATCSVTAVSLAFGTYNPFQVAHTDTTGNIAVTCTGKPGEAVTYSVALSAGRGTFPVRRMNTTSGTLLNYNIFTNVARTSVWGDATSGTILTNDAYTLATPSSTRNYPVYGRTFAAQKSALVGSYTDAIVVTLNF